MKLSHDIMNTLYILYCGNYAAYESRTLILSVWNPDIKRLRQKKKWVDYLICRITHVLKYIPVHLSLWMCCVIGRYNETWYKCNILVLKIWFRTKHADNVGCHSTLIIASWQWCHAMWSHYITFDIRFGHILFLY